ncbi:MAG TPA: EamA family transporter [Candidatus Limnocylindrales bacterium]|nr:EamA family transporter [Candidatus Limnocylindrales bacterium]
MDPIVFGLVAVAAVLHVGWNVVLKTAADPLVVAARSILASALVLVPAVAAGWLVAGRPAIPLEAVVVAAASGVVETAYFVFLSEAYRRGDLSVVYPVARGTAPLLAVAIGVLVLGERLGPVASLGVVALLAGILVLQRPWLAIRRGRAAATEAARGAVGFALLAGASIAVYSALDRVGTRLVGPWLYGGLLWAAMAAATVGWIWLAGRATLPIGRLPAGVTRGRRGSAAGADEPPDPVAAIGWRRPALAGLLSLAAYLLILAAYRVAPLTAVAPLRESAVVLASGWGAVGLGEAAGRRDAARRIVAAGIILAGALLLALDA